MARKHPVLAPLNAYHVRLHVDSGFVSDCAFDKQTRKVTRPHTPLWIYLTFNVFLLKGNYCCGREIELWKKLSQSDWERLITLHLRIVVCYKFLESPK